MGRLDGKKGSKLKLVWEQNEIQAFESVKKALLAELSLQIVDPNKPFILRVDSSGYAVGAVLEQTARTSGMPTVQDAFSGKTTPVAFMSRKLSTSQERTWDIRDKETYAVVAALEKWSSWIGLQPVLILTDHKSLESWYHEISQDPMGPSGRRARWHQKLSRFKLEVVYIKGKDNTVADALSRWAYPASQSVE